MNISNTAAQPRQAALHAPLAATKMLKLASILLAIASVAIAAFTGWTRAATTPESVIWAGVGVAAALAALAGPSVIRASSWAMRAAIVPAYAVAVAFSVFAALGSAASGRAVSASAEGHQAGVIERAQGKYNGALAKLASPKLTKAERYEAEQDRDEASAILDRTKPAAPANSDAAALVAYLALIGIKTDVKTATMALQAVAVLLIEVAGGLLLAAGSGSSLASAINQPAGPSGPNQTHPAGNALESQVVSADHAARQRREQVIDRLRSGPLFGRQTDIAQTLGMPKTTLRRVVASDDRLMLTALSDGRSRLELVS